MITLHTHNAQTAIFGVITLTVTRKDEDVVVIKLNGPAGVLIEEEVCIAPRVIVREVVKEPEVVINGITYYPDCPDDTP